MPLSEVTAALLVASLAHVSLSSNASRSVGIRFMAPLATAAAQNLPDFGV